MIDCLPQKNAKRRACVHTYAEEFRLAQKIMPFEKLHRDGSLWAKGQTIDDVPTGYWEWFRKDGTKLRSGHFKDGEQVGAWTTYDAKGKIYNVTAMGKTRVRRARARSD